ncbi:non-ribosomal peptide synthetase [Pseudosporangium ferrugineum]|uniref:Amino acid adenylation domain-containing protein n=1 Tax=Pseudosporangium ferrugineum TaxID=439699 RepID=A0A2T0RFB0_9ACTN|nr:non-ribosomal peptide synthetase [Pseudosporangium ferrugineum]PRY19894.1 amino acid adenylation domain-containing protein [Pseudosporangium ferrugineum]
MSTDTVLAGPIPRRARPALRRLPLSLSQEQIWLADRMQAGTSLYHIPMLFRLAGGVDADALETSVRHIVSRHDPLRASFPEENGVPVQVIQPQVPDDLVERHSLAALDGPARETALAALIDRVTEAPFDLSAGPLVRVAIVEVTPGDHLLVVVCHHLVFDGGSRGVLLDELNTAYTSYTAGDSPALAPLSVNYAAFVERQRSADLSGQLAYWQAELADPPARLQLPTTHPRPSVQSYRGAVLTAEVDAELIDRLVDFAAAAGTSLPAVLLAGYAVVLARHSGQNDFAVSVPLLGRPEAAYDSLIGCFINTIPVRIDATGALTFRQLVEQVSERLAGGLEHGDVPFNQIVQAIRPERDPSFAPLAQVSFGLLDDDVLGVPRLAAHPMDAIDHERTSAKFEFSLDVVQSADGTRVEAEYCTDLFDEATAARLVGHWTQVLGSAMAGPDRRIDELGLLTPAERATMLVDWNDTGTPPIPEARLQDLFEAQVRATPDAVAVVAGEDRLTYAELDRRANQLAHALQARGVGTETSVGVFMSRTAATIVAFLGVLKSGGVYVPLDPGYPPDRVAFMLADSRVDVLVVDASVAKLTPPGVTSQLCVDRDAAEIARHPDTAPVSRTTPANLSCMFYTSGSSGTPKCAMLTHANYVHYVTFWQRRYLDDTPMRVHLQMTSHAFDIFIADTTRALFTGATLVVCPHEVVMAPDQLYALMQREQVNSAEFITPILAALVDHVESVGGRLDFLDLLIAGSDIWYAGDYLRARALCRPDTRIIAAYGLSETSIDNTTLDGVEVGDDLTGIVPIGRPADRTQIYLLNDRLEPVPVGVVGELYVAGSAVGRGYYRRADLTADRLVPNPFGDRPGDRLYRSGDLACYRPDGVLEVIGRADNQVKVNGYRIELGEIESALRTHPAIDQAVILVHQGPAGHARLIGYATLRAGERATDATLREHLRQTLPAYMVPALVVVLDEFPLNANGKLNRRALPEPVERVGAVQRRPLSSTEEMVVAIWQDVLAMAEIGPEDNFFALGGSSLLMTQIVARVRHALGVELPIRALYQAPTVAALSAEIERARRERDSLPTAPAVTAGPRQWNAAHPLSYPQQQLAFHEEVDPGTATYLVPTVLRLRGQLSLPALQAAWDTVRSRHDVLRTTLTHVNGEVRQRVSAPATQPVTVLDLRGRSDAERAAADYVEADAHRPFDLWRDPPARSAVVTLADDEHLLLVTLHHIATDGWSGHVLLEEISAVYAARLADEEAVLPTLPVQYADFAVWQRDLVRSELGEALAAYWVRRLADAPVVADLPTDRPFGARTSHAGGYLPVAVPDELVTGLTELGREHAATKFMTLFATYGAVMRTYTGQADLVIGVPSANRTRVEVERLIGFFVNMLPLRVRIDADTTFRDLLDQVRETAVDAYAHQDLPFERIVENLAPARHSLQNPVFQMCFALDEPARNAAVLPGLAVAAEPGHLTTTKFDLDLSLEETAAGVAGGLFYRRDLFDEDTVRAITDDWLALAAALLAEPDRPIMAHVLPSAATLDATDPETSIRDGERPVPAGAVGEVYQRRPDGSLAATGRLGRRRRAGRWDPVSTSEEELWIGGSRVDVELVRRELAAAPQVNASTVAVAGGELIAEVQLGSATGRDGLDEYLRSRLPHHQRPRLIVESDTPAAELDDPLAELITALFGEVLDRPAPGPDESFFEAGGYSVLAMQFAALLTELIGQRVPVRLLFDHPTARSLAAALEPQMSVDARDRLARAIAEVDVPHDDH